MSSSSHFATDALHVGQDPEKNAGRAVIPPIYLTTTFKQPTPETHEHFFYGRLGNPNREGLELCLASLESAQYCSVFSSGMATTGAILAYLDSGDSVICSDDVYGGTNFYFKSMANHNGVKSKMVQMTDLTDFKSHFSATTKMIWFETPSNPLLKVIDIEEIVKIVRSINPEILVVVDNTFMSPYFQRPLLFGADIVMHSISKYINGHSDVIMGCAMTNSKKLADHFIYQQMIVGATPSPMDCFLAHRGVKTLQVRMNAHMQRALKVAQFLESEPRVLRVLYPELPSHPQHAVHKKQTTGMSGMISFYLTGNLANVKKFLHSLKFFPLAVSLGGVESLIEHPALMTHASIPVAEREQLGISDTLVRLSVGLEDPKDLIEDIKSALDVAFATSKL